MGSGNEILDMYIYETGTLLEQLEDRRGDEIFLRKKGKSLAQHRKSGLRQRENCKKTVNWLTLVGQLAFFINFYY